jgi:hypothetical protein
LELGDEGVVRVGTWGRRGEWSVWSGARRKERKKERKRKEGMSFGQIEFQLVVGGLSSLESVDWYVDAMHRARRSA